MDTPRTCPQCHQPLPPNAPDGLCPRCLLQAAFGPPPASAKEGLAGDFIDIGDPVEVGKRLPQFEIYELLGRGGMGVVYKARQLQLDRLVALKILPPGEARSPDFVARFTREARSLAKLNHPNIVHVYDFGETEGLYYIVMEFVEGVNLRELFQSRKLAPAEALAIVPKICDALEFAHDEGVVHRDIKPENILIDEKGRVKIADFGLAKLLRREALDMTLTLSGMSVGTVRYMAPEQMDKPDTVDHRADLYSLGVVLYEMLTGEVPMGRYDLPSQRAPVDVRLDDIVVHALEREPARRYQSAGDVRHDVESVASTPASPALAEGATAKATGSIGEAPALAPLDHRISAVFAVSLPAWFGRRAPWMQKLVQSFLTFVAIIALTAFLGYNMERRMVVSPAGGMVGAGTMRIGQPSPWFKIEFGPMGHHVTMSFLSSGLWIGLVGVAAGYLYHQFQRVRPSFDAADERRRRRQWVVAAIVVGVFYLAAAIFNLTMMTRHGSSNAKPSSLGSRWTAR